MSYFIKQLPNQRWAIYYENRLLASIGCYSTGMKILKSLREKESIKLPLKISQPSVEKKLIQAA